MFSNFPSKRLEGKGGEERNRKGGEEERRRGGKGEEGRVDQMCDFFIKYISLCVCHIIRAHPA